MLVLFGRFHLFKIISGKSIPSGPIHTNETSFSIKRKSVYGDKTHCIKTWNYIFKVITIEFNFALFFIDWMPNPADGQKKLRPVSAMPPQPNEQNYSISRPGYHSVGFFDTKSTVDIHKTNWPPICAKKSLGNTEYMLLENTPLSLCVECIDKFPNIRIIHRAITFKISWI